MERYLKLKEAAKNNAKKGIYELDYEKETDSILVINAKSKKVNYKVENESDEMLIPTSIYFEI